MTTKSALIKLAEAIEKMAPPAPDMNKLELLQREESRLENALDALEMSMLEAQLAVYRIRKYELWRAATGPDGYGYATLDEYYEHRWKPRLSRTRFFALGSTLLRLESLGIPPEEQEVSPALAHKFTVEMGKWDYKSQELVEPCSGLLKLSEDLNRPVEEVARELYVRAADVAKEYGAREALLMLKETLGKPILQFTKLSEDDEPLLVEIYYTKLEEETLEDGRVEPILKPYRYYLRSDEPLPFDLLKQLAQKLYWREEPRKW
jgi:hypothetical protein